MSIPNKISLKLNKSSHRKQSLQKQVAHFYSNTKNEAKETTIIKDPIKAKPNMTQEKNKKTQQKEETTKQTQQKEETTKQTQQDPQLEFDPKTNMWVPAVTNQLIENQQQIYQQKSKHTKRKNLKRKEQNQEKKTNEKVEEEQKTNGDEQEIQKRVDEYFGVKKLQRIDKKKSTGNTIENSKEKNNKSKTIARITGLPRDISVEEIYKHFSKCGIIEKNEETKKPEIKIIYDSSEQDKSGAELKYAMPQSLDNALYILDGSEIRANWPIRITRADSEPQEMRNETKRSKTKTRAKKQENPDLSWDYLLGEDPKEAQKREKFAKKMERTVVLKHMFRPDEVQTTQDVVALEDEISEECRNFGIVNEIIICDKEPEGVVMIRFANESHAQKCVLALNGRWFDSRRVIASVWDGTVYKRDPSKASQEERVKIFGKWIENQEEDDNQKKNI
ncbi:splicing factor u2af-associated protein [Anaeramoeba ignava]|uniref:Splicing factor u2af-associated protein n=1 Tax=Anaeramoeba ignava TaxID=1746090 RepID=A0A9Q0REI3_ANAIG|nr:splicing factor u2af-associated protein [Anaeramoeba ignava]